MDTDAVITLDTAPNINDIHLESTVSGDGFSVNHITSTIIDYFASITPYGITLGRNTDANVISLTNNPSTITLTSDSGGGAETVTLSGGSLDFGNGSKLQKGTTDAGIGGNGGIALKCSVDYELKWEAGRLYTMEQDGFTIRRVDHCGTTTPDFSDDNTKGFVVGSIWTLDDGTSYICTNAGVGVAVWVSHIPFVNGDGLSFNNTTNTLSCSTNIARRAGNQTFTGNNNFGTATTGVTTTFYGQVELNDQALTNGTSAVTRDLADTRYGATFVGIKTEQVISADNTPITLTSVTLPVGMYQIDSNISAFAATANGGYLFGLRASNNIRLSLFEQYGADSLTTSNSAVVSDSTTLSQRAITTSTSTSNKRQLMGLLEVLTADTVVSLEFSQNTTVPLVPATTRKRAYIIARKVV
jgi:hypothetical protein